MTHLILSSAKMILDSDMVELSNIITIDTVLLSEDNPKLYQTLNKYKIFKEYKLYKNYFDLDILNDVLILNKVYNFNKVIPLSEGDILRAGQIREALGIAGSKTADLIYFRDKYQMKKLASSYGISVSMPCRISSKEQLINYAKNNFPIIIKPLDGRGSANTFKLTNEQDILGFINNSYYENSIAEKFITGEVYHIDGLFINGKVVVCSPAKYVSNCLEFVNGGDLGSYTLMSDNPKFKKLCSFAKYLLENVFPTPLNSLFHIEVFVDENDNIILCELACRIGGNNIAREVEIAYGVNIKYEYLRYEFNENYKKTYQTTPLKCGGRYLIPPSDGILIDFEAPNIASSSIIEFNTNAEIGKLYSKMKQSNSEIFRFVINANNEEAVLKDFTNINTWKTQHVKWNFT